MRLVVFLLGAALAAVSHSFVIPDSLEDGVYVYDSATGNHTKAETQPATGDLPQISNSTMSVAKSSTTPKITCGTTILSTLDYASALQQLQYSCRGQTVPKHSHMYAKYGDAMAFMCNYAANTCYSSDLAKYMGSVNTKCGTTSISDTTGYVRVNTGLSFGYTTAQESAC